VNGNDAGNGINNPPGGGGGIRINNAPGTVIGNTTGRNVIGGNGGPNPWQVGVGILVEGPAVSPRPVIRHNYIGLDQTGILRRSNENKGIDLESPAIVGGSNPNEGNYIAGNGDTAGGAGILVGVNAGGSMIQGNIIGLNVNGDAVGNGYSGVTVFANSMTSIGGSTASAGNVISGNGVYGISVIQAGGNPVPDGTIIANNLIGTAPNGSTARPNGGSQPGGQGGIYAGGTNMTIGGFGQGNKIVNNLGTGIIVAGAGNHVAIDDNVIAFNSARGIDLGNDGVTVNDPGDGDSGPNDLLNYPVVSGVTNNLGNGHTWVFVDSNALPPGYNTVAFYKNQFCDPSGYGQGEQVVIRFGINGGQGNISLDLNQTVPVGWFVTATTLNVASGNTSEFSNCLQVPQNPPSISSVEPAAFASGQMITINGSNFAAQNPADVVVRQNGNDIQVSYVWMYSATKIIARTTGLANGPAAVVVKTNQQNPEATFNVTIQTQEGAPNFMHMHNGTCGGFGGPGDTTQSWSAGDLYLVASGIDTSGVEVVFTPQGGGGSVITAPVHTCGYPFGGDVAVQVQVPALAPGNYNVTMRSNSTGHESPDSNSKPITIIEPFVGAYMGGAANGKNPGGQFPPFTIGTMQANKSVTISASGLANYGGQNAGPDGSGGPCGVFCLAPALPAHALLARVANGSWVLIGSGPTLLTNGASEGWLELAMNDDNYSDNAGGWTVSVSPQ
jgi:hypothetical protein